MQKTIVATVIIVGDVTMVATGINHGKYKKR
jgi:precorrin isomerase